MDGIWVGEVSRGGSADNGTWKCTPTPLVLFPSPQIKTDLAEKSNWRELGQGVKGAKGGSICKLIETRDDPPGQL